MWTEDEWIAFVLVNIIAFVASRNTILRRSRKQEKRAREVLERELEAERAGWQQAYQEQNRHIEHCHKLLETKEDTIEQLTSQIRAMRQLHLN